MNRAPRWSADDRTLIAVAAARAPSVHNTQPWQLEFGAGHVSLLERTDVTLPRHDPFGRDRTISCGAALTNIRLAVRRAGRAARVRPYPDPSRRDEVGRVEVGVERPTTAAEGAVFDAIGTRHSHRRPFAAEPVADAVLAPVLTAPVVAGVQMVPIPPASAPALARLLGFAAMVVRDDDAYQRELQIWTATDARGGDGYRPAPRRVRSLPWAGLVDRDTAIPDHHVLTERLAAETLVLFTTVGDGRSDHLNAGMALEQVWLDLTARGLVASVLTQPLHVVDVRAGLIERLDLAGYPQALLRIGYPATAVRGLTGR